MNRIKLYLPESPLGLQILTLLCFSLAVLGICAGHVSTFTHYLLLALLVFSGVTSRWYIKRFRSLQIRALDWQIAKQRCTVYLANNDQLAVVDLNPRCILRWLIVIELQLEGRLQTESIFLFRNNFDKENWRRLSVALRWAIPHFNQR